MSVLADEKQFHNPPPEIDLKKRDSIAITALAKEIAYRTRNALRHFDIYREEQLLIEELREKKKKLKRQESPRPVQIAQELLAIDEEGNLPKRLFDIPTFRAVEYVKHTLRDTTEDAAEGWQLFLTYRADTQ